MARAGGRAGKVCSSGRLTFPMRAASCKRRAAGRRPSSTSAGTSLCSTDSEDQVLVINRGLDQCAALLQDILQCDVKESPLKPHRMPSTRGSVRSSTVKARKTAARKPTTAPHVYKERGPLRRPLPPGLCNAAIQKPRARSPPLIVPSRNLDHVTTQMQCLNHVSGPVTYSASAPPGPETSALYNGRLPTSTPTLSPQHPANAQSSRNQDFPQTLPPGGIAHFPSSMSASSAFAMPGDIQASALHNSSVPTGYPVTHPANILSQLDNYKSLIRDSDLLQCVAAHLAQLQQTEPTLQNPAASHTVCEQGGPPTESEEASTSEDDSPGLQRVREISCQTSFNKHHNNKSPEKTEKKIKTVKYLLGEINSLVTHQGDGEAMRLVAELEHSVALLPVVAGSTNVHAEIALALQPLRSENAQLRRRLRILNQQLRERERAGRSDEQNSEVTALQSMNETLQHQLSELQKGLQSLQSKNEELQKVIEVHKEEESRKTTQIIQESEREVLHIQQQSDIAAGSMKKELEEAVGKMKSGQFKLEASEKENQILGITLRQRDAEVARLRELTRTLQASMAKLLCDLGKDNPKPQPRSSLTQAALGSYDRQAQSEQCPANHSIMNYLKRLETDQVFTGTESIYSSHPLLPAGGQVSCGKALNTQLSDDYGISKSHLPHDGPKSVRPPELAYSPRKQELGSESCYISSEDHRPDETVYLPLASSPSKPKYDSSLRLMCTPPKVCSMERDMDAGRQYPNGLSSSDRNLGVHLDSRYLCTLDATSRVEGPPSQIPPQSYPPPVLQQTTSLQFLDDPPSDRSLFEGKPDSTICSFSTFTSHDEQDFRNGLAALDANIAKLQRTLQNGGARK